MKQKRLIVCLLIMSIVMGNISLPGKTDASVHMKSRESYDKFKSRVEEYELELGDIPKDYSNRIGDLKPETYGTCRTSFWGAMPDAGHQLVVYDEKLYVNYYDEGLDLISSQTVELELPKWGGVYLGENYNYVVCGRNRQSSEQDGGEVYRVIQYDKYFNRMTSISFNSDETYTSAPFDSGNVSIAENDSTLIVYTSRLRLDGHQSNIAMRIHTEDMTVADTRGIDEFPDVHVSHSFRQIVRFDGKDAVYVDLSDAFPQRAVWLQSVYGEHAMLSIAGEVGNNLTYTEVTGIEISENSYLVTGCSLNNEENNVYLSCYNKDTQEVEGMWLTGINAFAPGEKVGNSQLIQIADNRYVVAWNVQQGVSDLLNYVIVDEKGHTVSELKKKQNAELTDMEACYEEQYGVCWINIQDGKVRLQSVSDFVEDGNYQAQIDYKKSDQVWNGSSDTSWYSSKQSVFEIYTAEQLAGLAELVNQGNDFDGKKIFLCNDLFLNKMPLASQNEWISIAQNDSLDEGEISFQGEFHGNGHTVYNIYISEDGKGGLFGQIGKKGIVSAVNVSQGQSDCGGIIANYNEGIIQFCHNYCIVGGSDGYIGGICNYNDNLIYKCQNDGTVWGRDAAGIVGSNKIGAATLNECSNVGCVQGSNSVAGIAVYNHGWIYNSYNVGILEDNFGTLNTARYMAGIAYYNVEYAGAMRGAIENCYSACAFEGSFGRIRNRDTICNEDYGEHVSGCYYYHPKYTSQYAEKVDQESLCSPDMISKLNQGKHNVMDCWTMDSENINNGFPINVADVNSQKRVYKRMPEVWSRLEKQEINVDLAEESHSIFLEMFFNDSVPEASLDAEELGNVTYEGDTKSGSIVIKLKKSGTGNILIHFPATEYICESTYQIKLNVSGNKEESTPKPTDHDRPTINPSPSLTPSPVIPTNTPLTTTAPPTAEPSVSPILPDADWTAEPTIWPDESDDYARNGIEVGQTITANKMEYMITKFHSGATTGEVILMGMADKNYYQNPAHLKTGNTLTIYGIVFKITAIADNAFNGCKKLKTVTIGKNVTRIGKRAFYKCKKLKTIHVKSTKLKSTSVATQAFKGIYKKAIIKVPKKKKKAYKKWLKKKGITKFMKIK